MTTLLFLVLGLGAGVLTTLAGQGGGLLLLLACSAVLGPHEALAITAPALLLGNLHRTLLFRAHIDRAVATRMVAGALPGALAGGLLAGVTPAWALQGMLVFMTAVAIAKALGLVRFQVPTNALGPAGLVVGAMTGTSGGAGVLFAPVLLSAGLTGKAFVATTSIVAVAAHVGRVAGYAGLGLFARELIGPTIAVSAAIFVGNALGGRLYGVITANGRKPGRVVAIEYGTLVVCVALSVAGLG
ncbi:MAG: TSUP family transporter [Labilithrix sp.]|nr:TSUP family transporter [Labilithrix sp.]